MFHIKPADLKGRVRWHMTAADGPLVPLCDWQPNLILKEWGSIFGNLMAYGTASYRVSYMYLEYENVLDADDVVVAPIFGREPSDGIAYYDGLAMSATRDYLRIPIFAATVTTTDPVGFPAGNLVTFFGQTAGIVGVHGKPFSDTSNSKVFGGALVAAPAPADATQDLVFARAYPDAQFVKQPLLQFVLEWAYTLG